ncbi:MAG: hypothetical protein GY787_33685 [Alteromonadales bacterium]|nr:hypothetical protein [Alteromonadales bacterium]
MNKTILLIIFILSLLSFNSAFAKDIKLIVKEIGSDHYKSITVNESEVEAIKNNSKYLTVEEDIWVKSPTPAFIQKEAKTTYLTTSKSQRRITSKTQNLDVQAPNDPDFHFQYYFQDKSSNPGSSDILKATAKSVQNKKLRIAVIDGGFEDHEDMEWAYGYNFFDQ